MGMRRGATAAAVLVAVGLAGCGGVERVHGKFVPNPLPAKANEIALEFALAWCDWAVRCAALPVPGEAQCLDVFNVTMEPDSTFNSLQALEAEVLAGRVAFDGIQARACLDALSQQECSADPAEVATLLACRRAFRGTLSPGQRCVADEACGAGLFCFRPPGAGLCEGRCAQPGVRCRSDADCDSRDVCVQGSCHPAMAPPGARGKPCGTDDHCEAGLVCTDVELIQAPYRAARCMPPPGQGERCARDGSCGEGLRCVPSADGPQVRVCEPDGPFVEGLPCDPSVLWSCRGELVCVAPSIDERGACRSGRALGQTCSRLYECSGVFGETICDLESGRCVPRPKEGPCPGGDLFGCDLQTSYCDQSDPLAPVCRPFKASGDECTSVLECGSLLSAIACEPGDDGRSHCMPRVREICEP